MAIIHAGQPNQSEFEELHPHLPRIFLAGSIDNGSAVDWQTTTAEYIEKETNGKVMIYNPRRPDWDANASREMIKDQILWEQTKLHNSDIVLFYFAPHSLSPITLLELGICLSGSVPVEVCCSDKFWRYTNVETTCEFFGVTLHPTMEDAIDATIARCL